MLTTLSGMLRGLGLRRIRAHGSTGRPRYWCAPIHGAAARSPGSGAWASGGSSTSTSDGTRRTGWVTTGSSRATC